MTDDISLLQFKQQVLNDYRTAFTGQEMRRVGMIEADCHYITAQSDIAQVALARFVQPKDEYISAGLDLTLELARQSLSVPTFFSQLFTSAYDRYAHGTISLLSVAVGMALSRASMAQGKAVDGIVHCTLGGDFMADGDFFESVCFAAARSLPLNIILWNNSGTTTNGNLIRQLSEFGTLSKSHKTLVIEAVHADDYAALCRVMNTQTSRARSGVTTLTFVSGTSDGIKTFANWLTEKQIATSDQLSSIEEEVKNNVAKERRGAYLSSLASDAPIRHPHRRTIDISDLFPQAAMPIMPLPPMPGIVNKALGIALTGLLPILEVSATDVANSLILNYPTAKILMRTTDIRTGALLNALPKTTAVLTPACSAEAKELYATLTAQPKQAIVIEPGDASAETKTASPTEGGATRLHEGEDVTMIAYGIGTQPATDAVKMLDAHNMRVDLIHLHSLRPLDSNNLITDSLRKTKRLLIVDTDPDKQTATFIIASLAERFTPLRYLVSPPKVVAPRSSLRPVEAQDICKGVKSVF